MSPENPSPIVDGVEGVSVYGAEELSRQVFTEFHLRGLYPELVESDAVDFDRINGLATEIALDSEGHPGRALKDNVGSLKKFASEVVKNYLIDDGLERE